MNCEWKWSFGELIEIFLQTTTIDSFSLVWGSLPDYSTIVGRGALLVTQMHTIMVRCNAVSSVSEYWEPANARYNLCDTQGPRQYLSCTNDDAMGKDTL